MKSNIYSLAIHRGCTIMYILAVSRITPDAGAVSGQRRMGNGVAAVSQAGLASDIQRRLVCVPE